MNNDYNITLKARGFALSGVWPLYLWLIYLTAMLGLLILVIPLVYFFPVLKEAGLLIIVPEILLVNMLLMWLLARFYVVVLDPDMITVRWCGITMRSLPVSKLQLFCAVGNDREDILCLACCSVEEMAQRQEKRLLKSFLRKHDVPLRKRRADWQASFAREYLNSVRIDPLGIFKKHGIVMFEMQPAVQYLIQDLYPQLPYRNFTGVNSCYTSRFSGVKTNLAVCLTVQFYEYSVDLKPDGIHLSTKKEEVSFIPARQIKAAVRVDLFKGYEKYHPHHMPLMFLSCLSEEELAAQASKEAYGMIREDLPNLQALLAMMAATDRVLRWRIEQKDGCTLHYTENTLQTVRRLYPDIPINDIVANWLYDTAAGPS